MSAALKPLPGRVTVAEFLDWPDDPYGLRQQLVDGHVTLMAPSHVIHGMIAANLGYALVGHLRQARPGCSVVTEPGISPRIQGNTNVRIPDLGVTCAPVRGNAPLMLEPLLVAEIMSPSNHAETWSNIWTYFTIPSLMEILVIQSTSVGAEVFRRQQDGGWPETAEKVVALDGMVRLASIDAAFTLGEFYRGTDLAQPP